jgi:hypothetical protein
MHRLGITVLQVPEDPHHVTQKLLLEAQIKVPHHQDLHHMIRQLQQLLLLQALEARIEVIQHRQDLHQGTHRQLLQVSEVQIEAMEHH